MGWFGKIAFGSVGLFIGGPLGAIAGAALGHHFVDKKTELAPYEGTLGGGRQSAAFDVEQAQAAYFVSIFSILGKLAKADGIVSRDEITVVENFIRSMNISAEESSFAKQVFNQAKDSAYTIDDFARQFYTINRRNPQILQIFLDVLFQVAAADGVFHPAEETALSGIKNIFQVSDLQFDTIKARYFKDAGKYYKILSCTPQSSDEDIKKNYKKLVKDFHPDTVIAKGLPEEFISFATKRFQEIQDAYGQVKKERGSL